MIVIGPVRHPAGRARFRSARSAPRRGTPVRPDLLLSYIT